MKFLKKPKLRVRILWYQFNPVFLVEKVFKCVTLNLVSSSAKTELVLIFYTNGEFAWKY